MEGAPRVDSEPSTDEVRRLLEAGETEQAVEMIEELYARVVPTDEQYAVLDEEIQ